MIQKPVPLSRAYPKHEGSFSAVTVREPLGGWLLDLGEPYEAQYLSNGNRVVVEVVETVAEYVRRCVVEDDLRPLIDQLSLKDMRALKGAVLAFFLTGDEPDGTSQTTSPAVQTT